MIGDLELEEEKKTWGQVKVIGVKHKCVLKALQHQHFNYVPRAASIDLLKTH